MYRTQQSQKAGSNKKRNGMDMVSTAGLLYRAPVWRGMIARRLLGVLQYGWGSKMTLSEVSLDKPEHAPEGLIGVMRGEGGGLNVGDTFLLCKLHSGGSGDLALMSDVNLIADEDAR